MSHHIFDTYIGHKANYNALKQFGGNGNNVTEEKSLYERLGGVFAIAAVVNYFSDAILDNDLVGRNSPNEFLRQWSNDQVASRLPGLKFMRTLWVCEATGGPYRFEPSEKHETDHMNLSEAHKKFHISPEQFDKVAEILKESMVHFNVPEKEMNEVLGAFNAHKEEVTQGYYEMTA